MNYFSLLIGLGASLGLLRVLQVSPAATRLRWLGAALISFVGALLGARIGFLIAFHQYFTAHPQEMMRIDLGGLSWPGALAGALVFAWLGTRLLGFTPADGFDRLSRMLLPAAVAIWLGAWLSGAAYGQPLPAGTWWGLQTLDESGLISLRVPVQPLAVLSLLLILPICEGLTSQVKKKGVKGAWLFFILSVHSLLFSFLRYDSVQTFLGLRLDSWAAIGLLTLACIMLVITLAKPKPQKAVGME